MFGKLIVIIALVAGGYWYWSGPYQEGRQSGGEIQLQKNAKTMERCMRREASMNATMGMAGGGVSEDDGGVLCAEKHGLYLRDGQWHSKSD